MVYGYTRVSTVGQAKSGNSLEAQKSELEQAGVTQIYSDTYTGTKTDRPQLNALLDVLQSGDTLVVTKLDRMARSVTEGITLVESLLAKGIIVNIRNIGIMNDSPSGKLIRNIFLAFAEFERDMIVTRTQEGKAIAKLNPAFKDGRPEKFTPEQLHHAVELLENHSYKQVERMTKISKSTLQRAKRKARVTLLHTHSLHE